MIKNRLALFSSIILLGICMYLFFPYPNTAMLKEYSTFMSFPIHNEDGYIPLGIVGSILFVIALMLLVRGIEKYHFRTVIIVAIVYTLLPNLLVAAYQETIASGIAAVFYDGNGKCSFEAADDNILNGDCNLILTNRSNEAVSFELEFIDSSPFAKDMQMESLMNLAGPFRITIGADGSSSIHLKELLDLSDVPKHLERGAFSHIHIKISDGDTARVL